jgi:hypothetical protein
VYTDCSLRTTAIIVRADIDDGDVLVCRRQAAA